MAEEKKVNTTVFYLHAMTAGNIVYLKQFMHLQLCRKNALANSSAARHSKEIFDFISAVYCRVQLDQNKLIEKISTSLMQLSFTLL